MVKSWYAVYTRSRAEKKTLKLLKQNGFECYLPTVQTIQEWSDRKKKVELPLISSYVFVCLAEEERLQVLNIQGVVAFVSEKGIAAKIPDQQISLMKKAVNGNMNIQLEKGKIESGKQVKIMSGPLTGYQGKLVKQSNQTRFIIQLDAFDFTLTVELKAADVEQI